MPRSAYMLVLTSLAACSSIPSTRHTDAVQGWLGERSTVTKQLAWQSIDEQRDLTLASLTREPLDADGCVRVALLGNARVRQVYAELGITQADVYDATRLSNPKLGFMSASSVNGSKQTWTLTQQFSELLFFSYRHHQGRSRLHQAEQQMAQAVLKLEADVRSQYYRYVVAAQMAELVAHEFAAAEVSRDYAHTLFIAGNISELQWQQYRLGASETQIALKAAQLNAIAQKAELFTLLGLPMQNSKIELLEQLDVPAQQELDVAQLTTFAEEQRLDVSLLSEQLKQLDAQRTHTRRWFWLDDSQVQLERERDTDGSVLRGGGGSVGLPLFNQGGGARLRAQAQWEYTAAQLQALQLQIRNAVPVQVQDVLQQQSIVSTYREQMVPLRERLLALTQQQHNAMLMSTFELLQARRELSRAQQAYLMAVGQFWQAQVQLSHTVGGRLPEQVDPASAGMAVGVEPLP